MFAWLFQRLKLTVCIFSHFLAHYAAHLKLSSKALYHCPSFDQYCIELKNWVLFKKGAKSGNGNNFELYIKYYLMQNKLTRSQNSKLSGILLCINALCELLFWIVNYKLWPLEIKDKPWNKIVTELLQQKFEENTKNKS